MPKTLTRVDLEQLAHTPGEKSVETQAAINNALLREKKWTFEEILCNQDVFLRSCTIHEARRIIETAKAARQLQEIVERQADWVSITQHLIPEMEKICAGIRGRFFALPSIIAHQLNPDNPELAEQILTEAINELLTELQGTSIAAIANEKKQAERKFKKRGKLRL